MAFKFGNGIQLTTGYSLQAEVPLDVRSVVETIEDRDSLITQHGAYVGMIVRVKATGLSYVYTGAQPNGTDFSGCWEQLLVTGGTGGDGEAVLTIGDQTVNGVKTFTTAPKIGTETVTTVEHVATEIETLDTNIHDEVGSVFQGWHKNLDSVSKLTTEGFTYQNAAGEFQHMTIGQVANETVVTNTPASNSLTVGLANVGTAGTYFKVTTDSKGRVTAGENPTTIDGFGITDAVHKTGDELSGLLHYADSVSETTYTENSLVAKKYVDNIALGVNFHTAVETGTDDKTNIAGTYANGSDSAYPGVGATFTTAVKTISGVTLAVGQRVLLAGQTDKKQNGVYEVTSVADTVVMTRVADFDGHPQIVYNGASFLIAGGDHKGEIWRVGNVGTIVFGTDEIEFAQTYAPTPIKAGAGITVDGNLSIALAQGNTVKVISGKVEVSSGTSNTGKVLVAGADNTAASWKALDFSDIETGIVPLSQGGTGVDNSNGKVITIGDITLTSTGKTNVILPTEGTLVTLAGSEVLTNKTVKAETAGGTAITVQNGNIVGEPYGADQTMPQLVGFIIDCGTY